MKEIGETFKGWKQLTSVTIQDGVVNIGKSAFSDCSGLTSVTIQDGVVNIGESAFSNFSKLTSITIPNSVTSIGYKAFDKCSGLTSVSIGNSVTSIGGYAFSGCHGITSITIPESVKNIGGYAFYGCGVTSITIPKSVGSIGASAFYGCPITSVTIGMRNINDTFKGRKELTSITILDGVVNIGKSAFENCSGITSIIIPNTVKSIGEKAFQNCSGITSICIPNSVESVGNSAFSGCPITSATIGMKNVGNTFKDFPSLASVTLLDGVESIGDDAFQNCTNLTSITIPNSVMSIGEMAFEGTPWYANQQGDLVYAGLVLYKYRGSMPANTKMVIKEGTKGIAASAFSNCSGLTSITIPNTVTNIGEKAFYECNSLTFVNIPNNVTSIGANAFYNCCSLTSIFIPNSVTSIEEGAFYWCSSITSISIPNSVKNIGNNAFYGCDDLRDITINVNKDLEIGNSAFYSSVSKIENIAMFGMTLPVSTGSNFVSERIFQQATLSVPLALYSKYRSKSPWQRFSKIEKNKSVIYLRDDESYTSNEQNDIEEISYTRIFSTTSWEALYIPFSISYDDWKDDFELAYIKDIRQIDDNSDNVIDRTIMDIVMIENGEIAPNTPYLIRAKSIGNKTFTVNNAPLSKSEENSMDCSTTIAKFTFTGTYNPISTGTLKANDYYVMADGSLKKADDASELLPYRWYMKAESRNSSYNISNLAKTITVNVIDEDATGVRDLRTANDSSAIYDLNGRLVNEKYLKSGLYIRNGKKILVK